MASFSGREHECLSEAFALIDELQHLTTTEDITERRFQRPRRFRVSCLPDDATAASNRADRSVHSDHVMAA